MPRKILPDDTLQSVPLTPDTGGIRRSVRLAQTSENPISNNKKRRSSTSFEDSNVQNDNQPVRRTTRSTKTSFNEQPKKIITRRSSSNDLTTPRNSLKSLISEDFDESSEGNVGASRRCMSVSPSSESTLSRRSSVRKDSDNEREGTPVRRRTRRSMSTSPSGKKTTVVSGRAHLDPLSEDPAEEIDTDQTESQNDVKKSKRTLFAEASSKKTLLEKTVTVEDKNTEDTLKSPQKNVDTKESNHMSKNETSTNIYLENRRLTRSSKSKVKNLLEQGNINKIEDMDEEENESSSSLKIKHESPHNTLHEEDDDVSSTTSTLILNIVENSPSDVSSSSVPVMSLEKNEENSQESSEDPQESSKEHSALGNLTTENLDEVQGSEVSAVNSNLTNNKELEIDNKNEVKSINKNPNKKFKNVLSEKFTQSLNTESTEVDDTKFDALSNEQPLSPVIGSHKTEARSTLKISTTEEDGKQKSESGNAESLEEKSESKDTEKTLEIIEDSAEIIPETQKLVSSENNKEVDNHSKCDLKIAKPMMEKSEKKETEKVVEIPEDDKEVILESQTLVTSENNKEVDDQAESDLKIAECKMEICRSKDSEKPLESLEDNKEMISEAETLVTSETNKEVDLTKSDLKNAASVTEEPKSKEPEESLKISEDKMEMISEENKEVDNHGNTEVDKSDLKIEEFTMGECESNKSEKSLEIPDDEAETISKLENLMESEANKEVVDHVTIQEKFPEKTIVEISKTELNEKTSVMISEENIAVTECTLKEKPAPESAEGKSPFTFGGKKLLQRKSLFEPMEVDEEFSFIETQNIEKEDGQATPEDGQTTPDSTNKSDEKVETISCDKGASHNDEAFENLSVRYSRKSGERQLISLNSPKSNEQGINAKETNEEDSDDVFDEEFNTALEKLDEEHGSYLLTVGNELEKVTTKIKNSLVTVNGDEVVACSDNEETVEENLVKESTAVSDDEDIIPDSQMEGEVGKLKSHENKLDTIEEELRNVLRDEEEESDVKDVKVDDRNAENERNLENRCNESMSSGEFVKYTAADEEELSESFDDISLNLPKLDKISDMSSSDKENSTVDKSQEENNEKTETEDFNKSKDDTLLLKDFQNKQNVLCNYEASKSSKRLSLRKSSLNLPMKEDTEKTSFEENQKGLEENKENKIETNKKVEILSSIILKEPIPSSVIEESEKKSLEENQKRLNENKENNIKIEKKVEIISSIILKEPTPGVNQKKEQDISMQQSDEPEVPVESHEVEKPEYNEFIDYLSNDTIQTSSQEKQRKSKLSLRKSIIEKTQYKKTQSSLNTDTKTSLIEENFSDETDIVSLRLDHDNQSNNSNENSLHDSDGMDTLVLSEEESFRLMYPEQNNTPNLKKNKSKGSHYSSTIEDNKESKKKTKKTELEASFEASKEKTPNEKAKLKKRSLKSLDSTEKTKRSLDLSSSKAQKLKKSFLKNSIDCEEIENSQDSSLRESSKSQKIERKHKHQSISKEESLVFNPPDTLELSHGDDKKSDSKPHENSDRKDDSLKNDKRKHIKHPIEYSDNHESTYSSTPSVFTAENEAALNSVIQEVMTESTDEDHSGEEDICFNEFIDDMAEEGEEDTPSEDSNEIPDYGESVGSSSEYSNDESYESGSFIDNEEYDLLSGDEQDLEISPIQKVERKSKQRKDDEKNKPDKTNQKWSRIVELTDSSDDDDVFIVEDDGISSNVKNDESSSCKTESNKKKANEPDEVEEELERSITELIDEAMKRSPGIDRHKLVKNLQKTIKNRLLSVSPEKTESSQKEDSGKTDFTPPSSKVQLESVEVGIENSSNASASNVSFTSTKKKNKRKSKKSSSEELESSKNKVEKSFVKSPETDKHINICEESLEGSSKYNEFAGITPFNKKTKKITKKSSLNESSLQLTSPPSNKMSSSKRKVVKEEQIVASFNVNEQILTGPSKKRNKKASSSKRDGVENKHYAKVLQKKEVKVVSNSDSADDFESTADKPQRKIRKNKKAQNDDNPKKKKPKLENDEIPTYKSFKSPQAINDNENKKIRKQKKSRQAANLGLTNKDEKTGDRKLQMMTPSSSGITNKESKQFLSERIPEHLEITPRANLKSKKRKHDVLDDTVISSTYFSQAVDFSLFENNKKRKLERTIEKPIDWDVFELSPSDYKPSKSSNKLAPKPKGNLNMVEKFHPKDLKNRLLYDDARVRRMNTSKLLRKKGIYC